MPCKFSTRSLLVPKECSMSKETPTDSRWTRPTCSQSFRSTITATMTRRSWRRWVGVDNRVEVFIPDRLPPFQLQHTSHFRQPGREGKEDVRSRISEHSVGVPERETWEANHRKTRFLVRFWFEINEHFIINWEKIQKLTKHGLECIYFWSVHLRGMYPGD